MKLYLIRHGKTKGNLEKRYIGRTDQGLCPEGITELREKLAGGFFTGMENTNILLASPMKRCIETAGILLPEIEPVLIPQFREIDFGEFEGKNYQELCGNASYQAWIDSNGQTAFPGGESRERFVDRCLEGMSRVMSYVEQRYPGEADETVVTMVVHGGTIMSLLSTLGQGGGSYYDFMCGNGDGYVCELQGRGQVGFREGWLNAIRPLGQNGHSR